MISIEDISIIQVRNRIHLLVGCDRRNSAFTNANYLRTGKALCGILLPGQTLEAWFEELQARKSERNLIKSKENGQ